MSLISLIVAIALTGFLCWMVMQIPLPAQFRNIIMAVVVVFLVLFLLQEFGLISGIRTLRLK